MSEEIVLEASNLTKCFKIYKNPFDIFKEWVTFGKRTYHKDFWALNDVSFNLTKGEFLGIIGPNGAGKSTLLRIITDVLRPTGGTYKVSGKVLSILELTGGTDKDLTGRENVIRSGQLMGFPDGYVLERMERIKEFSELDDFFEQPLRMYSTGMKTRLSFSMFAFMDTDVLILDEVLAVGDIFFKQKCFARLAELLQQNTSIILVTHSMGIVQRYCERVILLNAGEKLYDGEPAEAIRQYLQLKGEKRADAIKKLELDEEGDGLDFPPLKKTGEESPQTPIHSQIDDWPPDSVFRIKSFPKQIGKARASLTRLAVVNDDGEPALTYKQGDSLRIYCEFQLKQDMEMPVVNMEIRDEHGLLIHGKNSIQNRTQSPTRVSRGSVVHYYQRVALNVAPGNYVINLDCTTLPSDGQWSPEKLGHPGEAGERKRIWRLEGAFAVSVLLRHGEDLELLHSGVCDLPGEGRMQIAPKV